MPAGHRLWLGRIVDLASSAYGVRGVGITPSEEQAALARERVAAAGLPTGSNWPARLARPRTAAGIDKVVKVGMFEHVGHQQSAR